MIKIVCAADDNYAMPLAVMLYSLLKHLNRQSFLEIFVIDGGITQKNKTKIIQSLKLYQNQFKINWLNPENSQLFSQIKTAKVSHHITLAAYYRLLIFDLLAVDIDKIIYLDSDLLIRHDLTYLWSTPLNDYCIAAIQDMGLPYVSSRYGLAIHRKLDISPETKYFNSGVMIINLTQWRQEEISQKVLDFLTKYSEKIRWHDQDALNAIFAGKWLEIDPRWNQIPYILNLKSWQDSPFSEDVFNQVINEPYIIHYATENKPWKYKATPRPNDNLYFEYLDQTVWKGWRPKELLSTRLKRYYQRFFAKK
jgi:lipopolysaccharide biosynthesis glycosyltransferase